MSYFYARQQVLL